MASHRCDGYEVFWRCLKSPAAYVEIVRWNGKMGDWTSLAEGQRPAVRGPDGDMVEATIVGNVIRGFVNGVEVFSARDDVSPPGDPGVGFNFVVGKTNVDYGFTSFEVDTYDG